MRKLGEIRREEARYNVKTEAKGKYSKGGNRESGRNAERINGMQCKSRKSERKVQTRKYRKCRC